MKLIRIDLNSWLIQMAGQTILLDPWLIDPMVFYGLPWLFTAYHRTPVPFTPNTLPAIDLLLLSQGLDDHCHKPTLAALDRQLSVVASPNAATVVNGLGYRNVTVLSHWQEHTIAETLQITAIPGANIQPGLVENGYLLRDRTTGETLYYEPHTAPIAALAERGITADVAIAPVIGQKLPVLGQVIMGPTEAVQLVQALHPKAYVMTTAGDIRAEGILPKLIKTVGSVEELRDRLKQTGLATNVLAPQPGEILDL